MTATATSRTLEFPSPDHEPVGYTVSCTPARDSDGRVGDWTITQLRETAFIARLQDALPKEACTYYAPTVNLFSGVVLSQKAFTIDHTVDRVRRVLRPGYLRGSDNLRIPCDGTVVGWHDGYLMSAGGCPLVVLTDTAPNGTGLCIAAHAGRESLIDRRVVLKKERSRVHFSVVNAMVEYARDKCGAKPEDLALRSFFALPSKRFFHDPRDADRAYRAYNSRLHGCLNERGQSIALYTREDGKVCLCLSELIRLQAEQERIGFIDTSKLSLPENGDYAYTQHPDEALRGLVRNLVVLRRH